MNTSIRKATLKDLDQLAPLFDKYRVYLKQKSDLPKVREYLKERITKNDSVIFLSFAVLNDSKKEVLMGFAQMYPAFSSLHLSRVWSLSDIFVELRFRRQNVGANLIEKCQELSKDTKSCGITLETDKTNVIGNRMYPQSGFILDQEHNIYYWNCL